MDKITHTDTITGTKYITIYAKNDIITSQKASDIVEDLQNSTTPVSTLHFIETTFLEGTFAQIMRAANHNTLQQLALESVRGLDKQTLFTALSTNTNLQNFILAGYREATSEFWIQLGNTLLGNTNLQELFLYANNIGADIREITAIAEVIRTHGSLQRVCLNENNIDDNGAKILAEALSSNKSIAAIDLSYNRITANGWDKIIRSLIDNTNIEAVGHSDTLPQQQIEAIDLIIERNAIIENLSEQLRTSIISSENNIHIGAQSFNLTEEENSSIDEIKQLHEQITRSLQRPEPQNSTEAILANLGNIQFNNETETAKQDEGPKSPTLPPPPIASIFSSGV